MPQGAAEGDAMHWHRHFGMECNRRAWRLAVAERSPAEDRAMLNAAHASAFHWSIAGSELNRIRATMLLAEVHALLGLGASAYDYALQVRDYFREHSAPDWEIAFTLVIFSHAAGAAGHRDQHRASYQAATSAVQAIADEEDREVVLKTFRQVPAP